MTDRQENFFSMCLRVEARLDANPSIITTFAALETARLSFKSRIANIRATDLIATNKLTGVAEDKKALRLSLVDSCIQYSASICAFAANNNNNTLYNEVYKPESVTERLRDDQLPTYSQILVDRLNANLAGLAEYGITAGTITNFQSLIDSYNAISQTPRSAIATRKAAIANLKVQFKEVATFLKKVLDKLIITLKPTYPIFTEEYFYDRNIYDDGGASNVLAIYEGTLAPSQSLALGGIPENTAFVRMQVLQVGIIDFGFTTNGTDFSGNTKTVNGINESTFSINYFGTVEASTQFLAKNISASNPVQYKVTMLKV
jgi:hypothetical protein